MRIFITKWFARFARKEGISTDKLIAAIREAEDGLNDGELGGGLIKKRVARAGAGKRGGYRTIIIYRPLKNGRFLFMVLPKVRQKILALLSYVNTKD